MSYVATIQIDLDAFSREQIEARMSTVMSAHIDAIVGADPTKLSLAGWSETDWKALVSAAFDVAAIEVFTRRIVLIPPELGTTK